MARGKPYGKLASFAICVILVSTGFYCIYSYSNSTPASVEIVGFNYDRAYNDLKVITEVGDNRLTGTDNEKKAADYILSEFTKAGLSNPHIEEYPATLYEVNSASLSLVEYNERLGIPKFNGDVKAYTHLVDFTVQSFSGSRSWLTFEDDIGKLTYVGNGSDQNAYSGAGGGAVMATNKDTYSEGAKGHTQLYADAGIAGASLNIIRNQQIHPESNFRPISFSMSVYNSEGHLVPFPDSPNYTKADYAHIPSIMVSDKAGAEIQDAVINGSYRIRVSISVTIEKRPCRAVVGDVLARNESADKGKFIMITAHHDSVYAGKGAMDDGSGTVEVIELARQMAKYNGTLEKAIRFATFGGEEEGLTGSYEYFKAHKAEIKSNMTANLNMDQTHVNLERGNLLWVIASTPQIQKDLISIRDVLMKKEPALQKYNVAISLTSIIVRGVDYETFQIEGVQGSTAGGSGSLEYHTSGDTIDKINAESLGVTSRIYGTYALMLARQQG